MNRIYDYRYGEWAVMLAFAVLVVTIFYQIATAFVAQGAASGDPLANAAMFPRIVGMLMSGLIGLIALSTVREIVTHKEVTPSDEPDEAPESQLQRQGMIVGMVLACILYLLLLVPLGFHIATTGMMIMMFSVLGVRPIWWAVLCGVAANLLVAIIFEGLLKVVVPTGVFGIALPHWLF